MADRPVPPRAEPRPIATTLHGDTRVDPYAWLRGKDLPEVIAHLEAENAYCESMTAHTREMQERLYAEIVDRIQETDETVPYRRGDGWYSSRTEEGKQYRTYLRRRTLDAEPEVILDLNARAEGKGFLGLGVFAVSPDGRLLAWSEDTEGAERYFLRIRDLDTGEELSDVLDDVSGAVWASDSSTLFYTVPDAARRPYRLHRRRVGESAKHGTPLVEEPDERFRLGIRRTRSGAFLLATSASATTSEVRTLPADRPGDPLRLLIPRREGHEYDVDHRGDRFYIRTNRYARNFRVVSAPVDDPSETNWREEVPHRPEVKVSRIDCFTGHLVLWERSEGLPRLRIRDLRGGEERAVPFPDPVYHAEPGPNPEFDASSIRVRYESPVRPESDFEVDLASGGTTLLKERPVLGGFDRTRYRCERLFATAPDGTRVPITVSYRTDALRNGPAPTYLIGYGAYGISYPAVFSSPLVSLLDRGMVVAVAHVRGGGEMGEAWREGGRRFAKWNSFLDFIACAEHLVAVGYAARDRLAVMGGSAGGLLLGAVLNLRPELFAAAVVHVPFVDVLNTMLDETLPLTVPEYLEWGNPKEPEAYAYIKSYCPYTNVRAQRYPPILVTAGIHDTRVAYWEPAKWTARLRGMRTDSNPILLKTELGAGHGGPSGRYDALRETAFEFTFVLDRLGLGG